MDSSCGLAGFSRAAPVRINTLLLRNIAELVEEYKLFIKLNIMIMNGYEKGEGEAFRYTSVVQQKTPPGIRPAGWIGQLANWRLRCSFYQPSVR